MQENILYVVAAIGLLIALMIAIPAEEKKTATVATQKQVMSEEGYSPIPVGSFTEGGVGRKSPKDWRTTKIVRGKNKVQRLNLLKVGGREFNAEQIDRYIMRGDKKCVVLYDGTVIELRQEFLDELGSKKLNYMFDYAKESGNVPEGDIPEEVDDEIHGK